MTPERRARTVKLADPVFAELVGEQVRSVGRNDLPISPSVQVTNVTRAPSAAYLAIVAPVQIDSSSGCACTSSRLRSKPVSAGSPRPDHRMPGYDGELSQAAGPDAAVHARGAAGLTDISRRRRRSCSCGQERQRPGHLPVGGRRRHAARSASSPTRGRSARRGEPAAGGARPPRAGQGDRRGIVSYATDKRAHTLAVFPLSGEVWAVRWANADRRRGWLPAQHPRAGPPARPDRQRVAYVHEGALRVIDLATGEDTVVAAPRTASRFGLAEFVAAEEMGRTRGYWWSPDGTRLLIERVDESAGRRWHIADPANPERQPNDVAYPAAGTRTPTCRCSSPPRPTPARATRPRTRPPRSAGTVPLPLPGHRSWDKDLLIVVQTPRPEDDAAVQRRSPGRDPRGHRPALDRHHRRRPRAARRRQHRLDRDQRGHPAAGRRPSRPSWPTAAPVTPPGLQVRRILGTDGDDVLFTGVDRARPRSACGATGPAGLPRSPPRRACTAPTAGGGTTVLTSRTLDRRGPAVRSRTSGAGSRRGIASLAEEPNLPLPAPRFLEAGPDRDPHRGAVPVLAPAGHARCRCSWTRTAGPARSGWCKTASPSCPRSGSPSRGSRSSWRTAAARRAAARRGTGRSPATSPPACSTTR